MQAGVEAGMVPAHGRRYPFELSGHVEHLATIHCGYDELNEVLAESLAVLGPLGVSDLVTLAALRDGQDSARLGATGTLFAELPQHQIVAIVPPRADSPGTGVALRRLRDALAPFTPAELARVTRLNPLVSAAVQRFRADGVDLSSTALVFRDHLLLEKLNLLRGLTLLGLRPERCLVIGKPDSTAYRFRVIADLRAAGFCVADGSRSPSVRRWLTEQAAEVPCVVVDDGADLIIEMFRKDATDRRFAAVETTTKGVRLLRAAGLTDQVLNVSDTSLKSSMNRRIAVSCVYRFREILRHETLAGEGCVVVGYGRLGRHISALLAGLGMRVRVVDTEADARERARADGFTTATDLLAATSAGGVRVLFGCSGTPSVSMAAVKALGPRPVLCSVSSQDLRQVLEELRRDATARLIRGVGSRFDTGEQSVTVLADGHAVNLFEAEGVSELEYDPFTALICAATVESARTLTGERPAPVDAEALCRWVNGLTLAP